MNIPLADTITGLEASLDRAFLDLLQDFNLSRSLNFDKLQEPALRFFTANADAANHDEFFKRFYTIWRPLLDRGQYDPAESIWENALKSALKWEAQNRGAFIHKGTPFYFWGVTAIIRGNIDKGYALMHQALTEDVRTSGEPFPQSPAFLFTALKYDDENQAFRQWLLLLADFIDTFLKNYRASFDKRLTLDDVRTRFLAKPPSLDSLFLFAYLLARLYQLSRTPDYALRSGFAGQLQANLLFELCLVIDAAIKAKRSNPKVWKFIDLALQLSQKAGLMLTKGELREVNDECNQDFGRTLSRLGSGTFQFKSSRRPSRLETDLCIAYALRNHGAHSAWAPDVIWEKYPDILRSLFNVFFICIETLY